MSTLSPEKFGLTKRTVLKELSPGSVAIVMDRKSRIIMKDGNTIAEKAAQIQSVDESLTVSLLTSAPVCSKTTAFLSEKGIEVHRL